MNNGLNGRYLEQLEAWNEARKLASDLVTAFNRGNLEAVMSKWNTEVKFPSLNKVKSLITEVLFLNGRNTIDKIAREILTWEDSEMVDNQHAALAA